MKRGVKASPPSELQARGTFRPHRHGKTVQLAEPVALPIQPEWLTEAGREVWLDEIGRLSTARMATELDSGMFGTFCNLMGALNLAWRSGEVPPTGAIMEARKMAEQFGLFGTKSRLKGAGDAGKAQNPFTRNGVRPPG